MPPWTQAPFDQIPRFDPPWPHATDPKADLLDEAKRCVTVERNAEYDAPERNMERTARFFNAVLGDKLKEPISSVDVPMLMIGLKLARLAYDPTKRDSWVDIAGWAACGWDVIG